MEQSTWAGMMINWFPMLLLVGVWVWFFLIQRRSGGAYGQYYKDLIAAQRDMQESMRRQADALERLAAALEKRTP
jgi:hypothetical protein